MPRARSARSDTSDAEDGLQEQEYNKLCRQLQIMKGDSEAYTQESQNMIRKQKAEIEALESEKEELLVQFRLAESKTNQNRDEMRTNMLTDLLEGMDDTQRDTDDEKKRCEELDSEMKEWERKINDQHKNMGGVHMSRQHTVKTQKNVRKLKDKLDTTMKKFNSYLSMNAKFRDEISSLRLERSRFENLYLKLDKELKALRQSIGEVVDQSTVAYDARDEAQAKMILLKEKADKDIQQHNAEMKELIRIIDHDRKLKEFMGIKGQERHEDPQQVAWRQRKEAMEAEKKKGQQEDSVESYDAAFTRIKEITGEEDIDLLVKKFIEVEDRNFALFNYVNEQNNEIDKLQEDIESIKEDIEKFNSQGVETEEKRKAILKQLEEKQAKASKQADEHDERLKAVMKILDQLRAGVESLFGKINCNRSSIDDMLGASEGVTDQSMIQYLGIIEQRTNELLSMQAYLQSKDYERYDPKAAGLLGEGPQAPAQAMQIVPPSVGDEYDSDASEQSDEDNRPFTRTELQGKVIKTVKKRETAAAKGEFRYDLTNARETTKKDKKDKGKR